MISMLLTLAAWTQAAPVAKPVTPDSAPPAVVEWCRARGRATDALSAALSAAPAPDKPASRIVIVGRAFEGTHELVTFERDLVARVTGFAVVALDVGLVEGEAANRFVQTGEGDPSAIAATFGAWGWSANEAAEVLKALRAREVRPLVVGIGVGSPKQPCELALKFIEKISPPSLPRSEFVLAPLRTDGINGRPRYYQLSDNQRGILRYGVEETISLLGDQMEGLADMAKPVEFARCMQLLHAIRQYEQTMRFELEAGEDDPRGQILAENLIAAVATMPTARVLVLARLRDLGRVGDLSSFPSKLRTLGQLESSCIATACGEAVFLAYDPNDHVPGPLVARNVTVEAASRTLLENALGSAAPAGAAGASWFDWRGASVTGEVQAWFAHRRTIRSAGPWCGGAVETPWDFDLLRDFDAVVWFPKVGLTTTPPPPAPSSDSNAPK